MLKQVSLFFNSLKIRIIFSAVLMTLVLLPIVGFTIINAYEQHMETSIKNELKAYGYSILAVAEIEDRKLNVPEFLLENQFNVDQSGLYAFFTSAKNSAEVNWRTSSLISLNAPQNVSLPEVGGTDFYTAELINTAHFAFSFTVEFESEGVFYPLTLHILKDQSEIQLMLKKFQNKLWLLLLVLIVCLIGFQFIWLIWSLKPLSNLTQELKTIEQGKADKLNKRYPKELSQVTSQLNQLLRAEQQQRTRYRNALSDLAHSLKTPLAVIKSQVSKDSEVNQQLDNMNNIVEHQLKRAQSAGHSSWHLGTDIQNCSDKLVVSLQKIYIDKALDFCVDIADDVAFKGDEADLLEILGNLLDNAAKAAKSKVALTVQETSRQLIIEVEDDGKGIAPELKDQILQRGTRADTYQQGHGIGLAIVRDLVDSYQGSLNISQSKNLGGAKFTLLFTTHS